MEEQFLNLQKKFNHISKKGYIKGIYNTSSSIGRTFENELGLEMNKESIPDYQNIEIKTRRGYTKSTLTLFNAVPNGQNEGELKRIKDTYGYPYKKDKNYKVLFAEVFSNKLNFGGAKYQYKLDIDKNMQKVFLCIYNKKGILLERKIFWTFNYLQEKLLNKIKYLAIIKAWPKKIDGWNYFKYYKINFYVLKNFDKFIECLENGKIKLIIKINIHLDEKHYGQMYDHGCGFDISEEDISKLFYNYKIIK